MMSVEALLKLHGNCLHDSALDCFGLTLLTLISTGTAVIP